MCICIYWSMTIEDLYTLSVNYCFWIMFFFHVFKVFWLFLSLSETLYKIHHHHHHHHHQDHPDVHWCVQLWMWVMWLSPGTKETVYCPASVCLISASVSLYLWRWNIRIKTPTAVCWTIPSETRLNIWTSLNSVTHVQVRQSWYMWFCTHSLTLMTVSLFLSFSSSSLSLSDSVDLCWISVDCSCSRDLLHLQET